MKKYFALFSIVLFAVVAMAQERTVNVGLKTGVFYIQHASAADTLVETNQDTIDFVFENQNREAIEKLIFSASLRSFGKKVRTSATLPASLMPGRARA